MQMRLLDASDLDDVIATFQRAFADYVVKVRLDRDALIQLMQRRGADLSVSAGAFEDGKMMAVMVVALDRFEDVPTAYDVFTAVVPEARGQGLAGRLFEAAIPACVGGGAQRFLLEVIETNEPAIRAYRKVGFRERRQLRIYTFEGAFTMPDHLRVVDSSVDDALEARPVQTAQPSWQNSDTSIRRAGREIVAFRAEASSRCVGVAFCSPRTGDVPQLHVEFGRADVLQALLAAARSRIGADRPMRMVNVDASVGWLCGALSELATAEGPSQLELQLAI